MKGAVIGGGITGLTMCHALLKNGIKPFLYEKSSMINSKGAGLTLWKNAMTSFQYLNPYIANSIKEVSEPITKRAWKTNSGKTLNITTLDGDDCLCLPYTSLMDILQRELPKDTILTSQELTKFQETQGGVSLTFQNGKTTDANFLIGCDGISSIVRFKTLPEARGMPLNFSSYRGITQRPIASFEPNSLVEYLGKNLRIQLTSMKNGHVYWVAHETLRPDFIPTSNKEHILKEFASFPSVIRDAVEATHENDTIKNDIIVLDPNYTRKFASSHVCIAGDAKNLMSPELGLGACLGVEDAALLSVYLGQGFNEDTLESWEEARLKRVKDLQMITNALSKLMNATSTYRSWVRNWSLRVASSKLMKGHIHEQTHWSPISQK